jgi:hypothetical protein
MTSEKHGWRAMTEAPKDGTRILVTVRPTEQGPAEVDMVYWASADLSATEGWRAADSQPGQVFIYAEPELLCWMPLPQAGARQPAVMPPPWEGDDPGELFGSGI